MNLRDLSDDVLHREIKTLKVKLAPLKSEYNRRQKAKRPRSAKVKVRKVKSEGEKERARLYAEFEADKCWRCFRPGNYPPPGWHRPFGIERCHITKDGTGKRCEDVRLIVALCSRCHADHTAGRLSTANMLWLKRANDKDNWDERFLQEHSIRRLPVPEQPT